MIILVEGIVRTEIEDDEKTDLLKVGRMATKHVDLQKQKEFAETLCHACFQVGDWTFKPIKVAIVTNYLVFAAQNGRLHFQGLA